MYTASFFIPRMLAEYEETRVKSIFANIICVGVVNRVDFVPIEGEPRFQKAFVHMDQIFNTPSNSHIMSEVEVDRGVRMYPSMFRNNEYWVLLKNKSPVQETKLNIHQIVENARILQGVVEAQAEEIKALREDMNKITRMGVVTHNMVSE